MTKWICDECSGLPCKMDDGDSAKSPHLCPIIRGKCANWRFMCGESTKKDKSLEERIEDLEAQMNAHYHIIDAMTGLVLK